MDSFLRGFVGKTWIHELVVARSRSVAVRSCEGKPSWCPSMVGTRTATYAFLAGHCFGSDENRDSYRAGPNFPGHEEKLFSTS